MTWNSNGFSIDLLWIMYETWLFFRLLFATKKYTLRTVVRLFWSVISMHKSVHKSSTSPLFWSVKLCKDLCVYVCNLHSLNSCVFYHWSMRFIVCMAKHLSDVRSLFESLIKSTNDHSSEMKNALQLYRTYVKHKL